MRDELPTNGWPAPRPSWSGSRKPSTAGRRPSTRRSSWPGQSAAGSTSVSRRRRRGRPSRRVPGSDGYLAAYARWRHAEALLGGDARAGRSTAAQLLGAAAAGAAELGAEPLAAAVADLARRAGVSLRREPGPTATTSSRSMSWRRAA